LIDITKIQHNQISCKKERRAHNPSEKWTNWTRWSCKKSNQMMKYKFNT